MSYMLHDESDPAREASARGTAQLVYLLQASAFFIGITYIAAVIVNYVKREDVTGTVAESHFRWQIRTFWYSVLWAALGVITSPILIGQLVLAINFVWILYRIIKGWLRVRDGKPMYL